MPKKSASKGSKQPEALESVKRLLILQLLRDGATSEEIGKILGVDSSVVRHMVPSGKKSGLKKE